MLGHIKVIERYFLFRLTYLLTRLHILFGLKKLV